MMMTAYTVTVTREDDLWVASATAPDGSRVGVLDFDNFADLHQTMPEYIADMTGDQPDSIAVTWRYEFGGKDVTDKLRRMMEATEALSQVQKDQENARRAALEAMRDAGLSQRTIADAAGISHQRVNQLLRAS